MKYSLKALGELYKMYILLHHSDVKISIILEDFVTNFDYIGAIVPIFVAET